MEKDGACFTEGATVRAGGGGRCTTAPPPPNRPGGQQGWAPVTYLFPWARLSWTASGPRLASQTEQITVVRPLGRGLWVPLPAASQKKEKKEKPTSSPSLGSFARRRPGGIPESLLPEEVGLGCRQEDLSRERDAHHIRFPTNDPDPPWPGAHLPLASPEPPLAGEGAPHSPAWPQAGQCGGGRGLSPPRGHG